MGFVQIGGMMVSPLLIIVIVAVASVIVWLGINQYKQGQYSKQAFGRLWCFFFTRSGKMYDMMLVEERGQVKQVVPPKLFGLAGKVQVRDFVKAPDGHEIGEYYVLPEMTFLAPWPPNKPKRQQIQVKCTAFIENVSLPVVMVNPEKWDPDKAKEVTAYLHAVAKDEAFAKAMLEDTKEVFGDMQTVAKGFKSIKLLQWVGFGTLAAAGIAAIIILQQGGKLDYIIRLLGG